MKRSQVRGTVRLFSQSIGGLAVRGEQPLHTQIGHTLTHYNHSGNEASYSCFNTFGFTLEFITTRNTIEFKTTKILYIHRF